MQAATKLKLRSSSSLSETARKIFGFRDLPRGWHYGEGVPPGYESFDTALFLAATAEAMSLFEVDAIPGFNGEIQLLLFHGPFYLEFTVEADGLIDYIREDSDVQVAQRDRLSLNQAIEILSEFLAEVWRSLGSYTPATTSAGKIVSAVSPSKNITMREFPLSTWTAPSMPAIRFADT